MSKLPQQIIGLIISGLWLVFAVPNLGAGRGVPSSEAAPNDATIFTGQVIPAFIGGAYDPTEAFQQLAGLPIYVVAYDNWGVADANKIKNNLAVRTQIRADGTFQAAGLPTAAHYGVYFPFRYTGNLRDPVQRTDGITKGVQTAQFRWPEARSSDCPNNGNDQIIDVFSYSFVCAGGIVVKDQLGNDVRLEQLFTTTTTRVDKENNTNVFPLVPVKTLKIVVDDPTANYEVYALRIASWFDGRPYTVITKPLNSPIIRGRTSTTPTEDNKDAVQTFQVYAPLGYYAVTVWRQGANSPDYKEWDGKSSLNSTSHGFAAAFVDKDWRDMQTETNLIAPGSTVTVWGTVTNDDGFLMARENSFLQMLDVNLQSVQGLDYKSRYQEGNSLDANFYSFYHPNGTSLPAPPDPSNWGIYMLSEDPTKNPGIIRGDNLCLYIQDDGYRANPQTPLRGIVSSTHGPIRVDLRAQKSEQGHVSGYDSGVFLKIRDEQNKPLPSASLRLTTGQDIVERFDIPALTKPHDADCLGNIYIPPNELKAGETYLAEIRSGNRLKYHLFTYPEDGYYDNNGQAIVLEQPSQFSQDSYKVLGKIPFPLGYTNAAPATGKVEIPGAILSGNQQLLSLTGFISLVEGKTQRPCPRSECEIVPANLRDPSSPQNFVDQFKVILPQPASSDLALKQCRAAAGAGNPSLIKGCEVINGVPLISYDYQILLQATLADEKRSVVEGEAMVTVSSTGYHTPSFQIMLNVINCAQTFPLSWRSAFRLGESFSNAINRATCNMGKFITSKIPGLMDSVHNWLYIQPLSSYHGIVFMWDTVRNIVNITFVLMLIAIGLASILRYEPETWNPAILIPRLLIGIVIANFSLLLVQAVVDVTNVTTNLVFRLGEMTILRLAPTTAGHVASGLVGLIAGTLILKSLVGALSNAAFSALASSMGLAAAGPVSVIVVVPLLSTVIGFLGALLLMFIGIVMLLVIRYYAIWLVAITAPVVWALQVLPLELSQTLKEKWKSTLLAFSFMQPVIAFTLTVGIVLITVSGEGDNGLFGGFGILLMGLITLGAVLKSPGFVSQFVGEGFLSTEGLGQAPEALREKLLGEEGFITQRFSKEKLAKGIRTAYQEGARFPTTKGLFKAFGRDVSRREAFKELLEESSPDASIPAQAAKLRQETLVRKVNTSLKAQIPAGMVGKGKTFERPPTTHVGEAPKIQDFLASNPNRQITYIDRSGAQVTKPVREFLREVAPAGASRKAQIEKGVEYVVGMGGGWNTLIDADETTRRPTPTIEAEKPQYEELASVIKAQARTHAHAVA